MTRRLVGILVAVSILSAGLVLWRRLRSPQVEDDWIQPPGFWQVDRSRTVSAEQRDELARLLSLPYSSTGERANGDSGVTFHDPERTWGTLNFYTSGHAPEAFVVDMDGRGVHRWRFPYERAFPHREPTQDTACWRRARLLPDGSLLAIYQSGGLIKLDRASSLIWAVDLGFYNDLDVGPDGTVYALTKEAVDLSELRAGEPVLEDFLVSITPDGHVARKVSLLAALRRSEYASCLDPLPKDADILHGNTVVLLDGDASTLFRRGRVLFSLREIDTIGVLDLADERVVWAQRGPWDGQHDPQPLPDGHILLFDNKGGPGGDSRVLEIDPTTGGIVWSFAHRSFRSPQGGTVQRLPNGDTLVTSSEQGRAFELTAGGEVVWEYVTPHRGGRDHELIATLWEVVRLGDDFDSTVLR